MTHTYIHVYTKKEYPVPHSSAPSVYERRSGKIITPLAPLCSTRNSGSGLSPRAHLDVFQVSNYVGCTLERFDILVTT